MGPVKTMEAQKQETKPLEVFTPKVEEILQAIEDQALREDMQQAVSLVLHAIAEIERIHLPQDHFEEGALDDAKGNMHYELAPGFLGAIVACNNLISFLSEKFPAPADMAEDSSDDDDFDLEFDLVDGPTGESDSLSGRQDENELIERSPREWVGEAVYAYGGMLRSRIFGFADRIRYSVEQGGGWPLLSELDDNLHKLTKAVQAVLFGILGTFNDRVSREDILPAYRSSLKDSVSLRTAINELSYHIGRFNEALSGENKHLAIPLVVAVSQRLASFSQNPAYRMMRADDKKAIIDFRATLYELRRSKDERAMGRLRITVEGFSKFLESMHAINHREVLVLHDQQIANDALEHLMDLVGQGQTDGRASTAVYIRTISALQVLQGRHPDLDDALRAFGDDSPPPPPQVPAAAMQWMQLMQSVSTTIG